MPCTTKSRSAPFGHTQGSMAVQRPRSTALPSSNRLNHKGTQRSKWLSHHKLTGGVNIISRHSYTRNHNMYMYICIWFSLPKVLETIPFWWLTIVVPSLAAGGVSPGWSHAAMMGKSDFSLSSLHHISARHQPRPRTETRGARIIIVARYSIILWLYCDYIHWK